MNENFIELKVRYDRVLHPKRVSPTPLTANSMAKLIVLLELEAAALTYTWVTPGNNKVQERDLFRDMSLDEGGLFGYSALIYPNMTSGLHSQESGHAYFVIRSGNYSSTRVKVPVMNSIIPETSEIPPSRIDEMNMAYNNNAAIIRDMTTEIEGLSTGMIYGTVDFYTESLDHPYGLEVVDGHRLVGGETVFFATTAGSMGVYRVSSGSWLKISQISAEQIVNIRKGNIFGGSSIKRQASGITVIVRYPDRPE